MASSAHGRTNNMIVIYNGGVNLHFLLLLESIRPSYKFFLAPSLPITGANASIVGTVVGLFDSLLFRRDST
jgi:hypothetical protein